MFKDGMIMNLLAQMLASTRTYHSQLPDVAIGAVICAPGDEKREGDGCVSQATRRGLSFVTFLDEAMHASPAHSQTMKTLAVILDGSFTSGSLVQQSNMQQLAPMPAQRP
eukprot:1153467-Pelagomonas_calceolata.AAC.9